MNWDIGGFLLLDPPLTLPVSSVPTHPADPETRQPRNPVSKCASLGFVLLWDM